MNHPFQQNHKPVNKAQVIKAFCGLVIMSTLFMPVSTHAATQEVHDILANGQMQDLDGVMRNSVYRGLDVVAPGGTLIRAAALGKVIYQEKQLAGGSSLLIWLGKDHFGNRVISSVIF